jgi:hypothetical protein
MSYDIYIGDAQRVTEDCDWAGCGFDWFVPSMTLPDAPQFDGDAMTGQSNSRHPSYRAWEDFTRKGGLHALFFHQTLGLMRDHPGCVFLTTEHYQAVKDARVMYDMRHPQAQPGWGDEQDPMLARLIWLEWWIMTTLKTAEVPAIFNH